MPVNSLSERCGRGPAALCSRLSMSRIAIQLSLLSAWALLVSIHAGEIDFLREVRPILSSHCFKCHGPDEATRKAGLRLDLREEALKPAKSGALAIVPGALDKSELLKRINTTDEDDLMPPPSAKHPLTAAQKEVLKQWIAQGAEYRPHWAFVKPVRPAIPPVKNPSWARNEIDYFILSRLEKEGLNPSSPADRATLVRRLYLDLIGLPPTIEQADAFIHDISPDGYERLVDSLLKSPHYGERWARRWLDLARYADTNGYEKDRPRSIWPYRDWVINALNSGMSFDQFTVEQIAGDLLPGATLEQKIATGFHRNTMLNEEGGVDPLEFRHHAMVDRVHVTATAWLGLTMACAQCHTHKYDPIQHQEYYSFMAFMNNADEPLLDVPSPDLQQKRQESLAKIDQLRSQLAEKFPAPSAIEWRIPASATFSSRESADGLLLADGSIRVTGPNPDKDIYEIDLSLSGRVSHLLLEALPDEEVINGGPGRTAHGNFVVTEIEAELGGKSVKFFEPEADHSQDGFPPANALDGKANTGWAVGTSAEKRFPRRLILKLAEPLELQTSSPFRIRLKQEYGGQHTLGRFRLSLGQDLNAGAELADKRREHLEKKFQAWLHQESRKVAAWTQARPTHASSEIPTLTIESDDAIFASGDFSKNDTYRLTFANVPAGTRAIRLQMLPDDRLPMRGPGRVAYEGPEGDFYLSNFQVYAGEREVKVASANQSFASGGNTAATAIDHDLQSGWSINGGQGKEHNAVFILAEPVAGELRLDLTCERYYAAGLGRFRIHFGADDKAMASPLPHEIYQTLVKTGADPKGPARGLLLSHFLEVAPELAPARAEIDKLRRDLPRFPTTLVMQERPAGHNRKTYRYHRGEFLQPRESIEPALPAFLSASTQAQPRNRLEFAHWLVSRDNPLTARVVMNRQWEAFFGRGLVRTLEDFGFQGELPSHPDLLDWLASEFMEQGWSMKSMHKLIVMSAAYRQSSSASQSLLERDPLNLLISRGPRFRIESEAVRDLALVASGLFADKIGGPSVFPPQPAGVTTEGAYGQLQWKVSEGPDRYRRGLYTYAKRTAPFAMTLTFDGPSGEACLARRERSNTPLQALTVLNDEVFMDAARTLGTWVTKQQGDPQAKLELIFRRFLTRPPTETERRQLASFYQKQLARFAGGDLKPAELAGRETATAEEAAWIALARVLLNLDETITKG